MRHTEEIGAIVKEYLRKFPTMRSQHLANMIFEKHPELGSAENIRNLIRYYKGKHGDVLRSMIASDEFFEKRKTDKQLIRELIQSTKLKRG